MRFQGFRVKLLMVVLCAPTFLGVLPGTVGVQTLLDGGRTASESEPGENESNETTSSQSVLKKTDRLRFFRKRITAYAVESLAFGTSGRLCGELRRHAFSRSMRVEHSSWNGVSAPLVC